jgi:hypothetical protein
MSDRSFNSYNTGTVSTSTDTVVSILPAETRLLVSHNEVNRMRRMMSSGNLFRVGILGAIVCLGLGSQAATQVAVSAVSAVPASAATRAMRDVTSNLPPLPGIFSDYMAPVVRNASLIDPRQTQAAA